MRDANIELMRLILCFFIVLHHHQYHIRQFRRLDNFYKLLITILFIPAVNCFIFITGYFGKSVKWRPSRIIILLIQIALTNVFASIYITYHKTHQIQWKDHLTYEILTERSWFHHCYLFIYLFLPALKALGSFFDERIYYLIFMTSIYYLFTFTKYEGFIRVSNGFSIPWFFILYIHGFCLKNHFNFKMKYKLFVYIGIYLLILYFVWKIQLIDQKEHPLLLYYCPKILKNSKITISYSNWPALIIAISLFKVFENIEIKNIILSKIICFLAKYIDVFFILHNNSKALWETIAKAKFLNNVKLLQLKYQIVIYSLYNFFFCFFYSFVFHCIFDIVFYSPIVSNLFNLLDNFLNSLFNLDSSDDAKKASIISENEKLIADNFQFQKTFE